MTEETKSSGITFETVVEILKGNSATIMTAVSGLILKQCMDAYMQLIKDEKDGNRKTEKEFVQNVVLLVLALWFVSGIWFDLHSKARADKRAEEEKAKRLQAEKRIEDAKKQLSEAEYKVLLEEDRRKRGEESYLEEQQRHKITETEKTKALTDAKVAKALHIRVEQLSKDKESEIKRLLEQQKIDQALLRKAEVEKKAAEMERDDMAKKKSKKQRCIIS